MSDSNGYVYDPEGIKLDVVKEIKEVRRGRIKEYAEAVSSAVYTEGKGIWTVPCDIALPCATQNELNLEDAKALLANGCFAVAEGANMPSTREATDLFVEKKILFMPGKAANAGGVATSGLEQSQNSLRLSWTFEEVDERLHKIMADILQRLRMRQSATAFPETMWQAPILQALRRLLRLCWVRELYKTE